MFTVKISCLFKVSFADRILFVICIIYRSIYAAVVERWNELNGVSGQEQKIPCCQSCPSLKQNAQVNRFTAEFMALLSSRLIQSAWNQYL